MEHNPKLIIHTEKLLHNMQTMVHAAHEKGVQIALVSKVVCAHPAVIDCINRSGADMLADSRMYEMKMALLAICHLLEILFLKKIIVI